MPIPPKAAQKPQEFTIHDTKRVDEYSWLQDIQEAEVQKYLKAENRYAEGVMRPTKAFQKKLYNEIRGRIIENDMSVPVKDGPYDYYVRTKKGKQYAIHCRREGGKGKEQIILDENELAKGEKYFSLGAAETSPDHRLLAYTSDTTGNENHTLYIKNLETGELVDERMTSVGDVVWAEDGEHLLYTLEEHPFPPRRVYRHRLGETQTNDVLVYEEKDPQWYVALGKSRSKDFIFIHAGNYKMTEVRYLPSREPGRVPTLIAPRRRDVRYSVEHHGDFFYILTNEKAVNFKILRTPVQNPTRSHWKLWLAHDATRSITGFVPFASFLILEVRERGSEEVYISSPEKEMYRVELPEGEHSVGVSPDIEYASSSIRMSYSSGTTPNTVFDYDVVTRLFRERKKQKVPGYKKELYTSERVWAKNGSVRIPIVIMRKYATRQNGRAPLLLEAYGSYGICSDPYFSVARLSLLDRGFIVALAHPRGGGEMGWKWHKDAHLLTKHRTCDDFIACAGFLVRNKYTSREKLAISGGSAGGMLMGQAMNKRAGLFAAALVYVPAADLVTALMDESLAGTRLHYDELGDPRKPKHYRYLMRQSPYENVREAEYPATLVRASVHDIRTPYWEAAKWVARLRARTGVRNTFLLKTELAGGHFGKSGRYEWIKEKAFDYAFLIGTIGGRYYTT